MSAVKTHFQDLPVTLDPARQLEIVHQHFDVAALPASQQLLAWCERMIGVVDLLTTRDEHRQPFRGWIDRYVVGEFLFADCYTDRITQDRTIARISRDNARSIVFHVFLGDTHGSELVYLGKRKDAALEGGIFAIDLDQPVQCRRAPCRHVTIFLPGELLQDVFPDPSALHGRALSPHLPAVRYLTGRVLSFAAQIRRMAPWDAYRVLREIVLQIADTFGEQAGLKGSKVALARAMAFDQARRYVQTNLHDDDLSPERVVESLGLSRPTVYRLFEHDGGLGAYIRHVRLRAAAAELVAWPGVQVRDVAYAHGFRSASDFTRAFRRAYGLAPQDMREYHDSLRVAPER
ncbi:helix-turn-helix transcriptional regulator [Paraburkholderia sp. Ac-20342]|uniref:AraC family transcriptional regulator n=1 Tax=Paraburkholderia sp. Ac-20342 TaxID=2703889 RepID=UPI0019808EC6|nr:AraC family transcriptional regulator [Paraburkholderia sp. Ac-20342]MBN3845545.1 helix-turn-helix transcriptional regulator [Paraburkholderia sp. Ac-20342]